MLEPGQKPQTPAIELAYYRARLPRLLRERRGKPREAPVRALMKWNSCHSSQGFFAKGV